MQEGSKVLIEFKECPRCRPNFLMKFLLKLIGRPYHLETVAELADKDLKEAGRVPKDKFSSLGAEPIALTDPRISLTVETLVIHNDICARCGFPFYTRVDRARGVVKAIPRQK